MIQNLSRLERTNENMLICSLCAFTPTTDGGELLDQGLNWWWSTWWRSGWPREHRQTVCTCAPPDQKGWTQSWVTLGSCKATHCKDSISFTSWMCSTLPSVHDYWLSCECFACYCQEHGRCSFASWVQQLVNCDSPLPWASWNLGLHLDCSALLIHMY